MPSQLEKAHVFRAMHERDGAFVIPNPWDIGSARMLAALGFEALATTSAGHAHSMGRREGNTSREEALEHCRQIVGATALPVAADLENGYGHTPEDAAITITGAGGVGLVGGSIEDATGDSDAPIYPFDKAVERVAAAVEAARRLDTPFMLTARAENYLHGRPDLADTIARLQAFQEAGADVLYAPGLHTRDHVIEVVRSVDRPVNVVMGLSGVQLSVEELGSIGVRRISLGTALSRAAYGAFLRAAREVVEHGTFTFASEAASFSDIEDLFEG
jgi:2-methylisocitrate lyase-like PEP mutase family enzyme